MKITINDKEIHIKEFFNVLNEIWLIVNDNCRVCKEKNYNDKQKLELIKKLMEEKLNFR